MSEAPARSSNNTVTDLEVKDAHIIFESVWTSLEREFGRDKLHFPREIFWLNGAPGAGKGTNTDFIQQYVFPGGMLPSPAKFKAAAASAGLELEAEFAFGADYAKTLCLWRDSFNHKIEEIYRLGFDEAFIRLWNFYLMYCAAGFSEKNIDVVQYTLKHQDAIHSSDALHP